LNASSEGVLPFLF